MSCWLTIPSKRPPEEAEQVLKLWRERGYKIALYVDDDDPRKTRPQMRNYHCVMGPADGLGYPGYARAVNVLCGVILANDPHAEWFICAGDDMEPDPTHSAEEIAEMCNWHFGSTQSALQCGDAYAGSYTPLQWKHFNAGHTFGVMQPTGDRWGEQRNTHPFTVWDRAPERCRICGLGKDAPGHMVGAYADRVCGSPWIGREFARRMYQGNGPYWPEYTHMGVDEELQAVAIKMGVLWQRPDLMHLHRHWGRAKEGHKYADAGSMPDFLKHANSPEEWDRYKRIFRAREASGFPGHEPLA